MGGGLNPAVQVGGVTPTSGMDEINFFGEAVDVDLQRPVLGP